jgi:methylenetetrahydrofolate--tRNA-(uracil-5-)-methyltransferase
LPGEILLQPGERLVTVVGGGLAGCEAAWQLAARGIDVVLYEMRPARMTPAHVTGHLAELVCSNSLGSDLADRAGGLLKAELRALGSIILACADETRVPAGGALAVDRKRFAQAVTDRVQSHPGIRVVRREVKAIPEGPAVIASGPLTSDVLASAIAQHAGEDNLAFYDAVAPIVSGDSVDMEVAFPASRYGRGGPDYVNCPMSREEYRIFVDALVRAERIALRGFESEDARFFEACLPVEVLASRGPGSLAFGPLRPTGLTDPRTGRRPHAVVQLRREDMPGTAYNLVGFQTNLRFREQERVFRLIPGLENALFLRYGQMHRNTFVRAPALLDPYFASDRRSDLQFAGQLTGTEGYIGSVASGLMAGVNLAHRLLQLRPLIAPPTTMVGSLTRYVTAAEPATFQPMKANFGLLPPLPGSRAGGKRARREAMVARALRDIQAFAELVGSLRRHNSDNDA